MVEQVPNEGVSAKPRTGRELADRIPTAVLRLNTVYLGIIALVAVGTVLRLTAGLLIPFVIAVLLSFIFLPVVNFLTKLRIPRILAITVVLLIFLAFGFLIVLIVYQSFQSLLSEYPLYQRKFLALIEELIERFELPPDLIQQMQITRTLGNAIVNVSSNFMSFASGFMVVLVYLLFLLMEQPYVRGRIRDALKDRATLRLSAIFLHINNQIARYIAVKLFVSALTAIVVFGAFTIIGFDFHLILDILTFLFNFIPSIGSIAISLLSTLFAVVQFAPDWGPVLATGISMTVTQFLIGNILDPKMLGDRLNLSPVIILFSLLLWGWLWGTAGLFLAVPMTVAGKIIFENIPGFEPIGILMGTGNFRALQTKNRGA